MTLNHFLRTQALRLALPVLLASAFSPRLAAQATAGQKTFPNPAEAAQALFKATQSGDQAQLLAVLGSDGKDLVYSGDPVADKQGMERFVKMYGAKHSLTTEAPGYKTLIVGVKDWPLPIPIVRDGLVWYFDSARGHDEILNRRIGENELGAIAVCEGYVRAQKEYAGKKHDGLPAGVYAQKLTSDPGKQNGLYWPVAPGARQSPMGPAIAAAAAEGYTGSGPAPYHGYIYKLITSQGAAAPGGAMSYIKDGKLSGGFALLAYPASYGVGGIMTFIVNQSGDIYQKDLGDQTSTAAPAITEYNPDDTWETLE